MLPVVPRAAQCAGKLQATRLKLQGKARDVGTCALRAFAVRPSPSEGTPVKAVPKGAQRIIGTPAVNLLCESGPSTAKAGICPENIKCRKTWPGLRCAACRMKRAVAFIGISADEFDCGCR